MPVPLHQFLSPPFTSMLTPISWPGQLGEMFLLGGRDAQEINYHNHDMSCTMFPTQL